MTTEQIIKIEALNRCTFQPGSYQKRFVRDMSTAPCDKELSEKQSSFLDKLYYMYRGQISASRYFDATKCPAFVKPVDTKAIQQAQEKIADWNAKVAN